MKELSVDNWFTEIDRALDYRREYGLEDSWSANEALLYNVHESQGNSGPNVIMSTGDSLVSVLTVPNPIITMVPRRSDVVVKAQIAESLVDMFIEELKVQEELEMSTLHAYLYGKGILKLGYDSEFGWDPALDLGLKKAKEGGGLEGSPLGLSMSQFDRDGNRLEFGNIRPGMPWFRAVLPHDFLVPFGTIGVDRDAPFAIHRVVRHIDLLRKDPKYEKTKDLQPNMSMEDFIKSYTTTLRPYQVGDTISSYGRARENRAEYVELWEIHDKRTGKVIVTATGYDKFLRNEGDALQINGLPFVDLGFVPKSRTFWTTPDAYYLRQAQNELTDITIQSQKQRRISVLKFLYDTDMIDPDEMDKALSSEVGVAVRVNARGRPLNEAIQFLQAPGNQLLYQEAENTRRNAREAVGFSRNQMGEYEASGRRTAFEASVVDRSSQLRMSRRHVSLMRAYKSFTHKVLGIVGEFWTAPRLAEVMDDQGQQQWMSYTGDLLKGDYFYEIGFSSEPIEDRQTRKQSALQTYMLMSQDPLVDPIELRRFLARSMNDPRFSKVFAPGVLAGDENARLLAQMQQQKLSGGGQGGGSSGQNLFAPQSFNSLQGMQTQAPPSVGE